MDIARKPPSPFYPNQPVPVELFVGRRREFEILERYARETSAGKPTSVFLEGEYGIGKTSLAQFFTFWAQRELGLFTLSVRLGGADTIDEFTQRVVEALLNQSRLLEPSGFEKIRDKFAKYIASVSIAGVEINTAELRHDAPLFSAGFLNTLVGVWGKIQDQHSGFVLVIDEINGIARNPQFGAFLKTLFEDNATAARPIPFMLVLCGTSGIRYQMIEAYKPVDRLFQLAVMDLWSDSEAEDFFRRAFASQNVEIGGEAGLLARFTDGFPKLAHVIGDEVYYANSDQRIDATDALEGIVRAARNVGEKFIDKQVYEELRSESYKRILSKLPQITRGLAFKKQDLDPLLEDEDKARLNNFLQKMIALNVLRHGEVWGEYQFLDRLTALYIRIKEEGRAKFVLGPDIDL